VDEEALLRSARDGDRDALGTLLTAQYDRCFAVCRRLLGDEEDARDATQEAMISIAKGLARFDGRSAFATWCYRIAANAALDELRRRTRRPLLHVVSRWQEGETDELEAAAAKSAHGRDVVGDAVADAVSVDVALARLPEDQRTAVVLRDLADLDYAEIALLTEVPVGTVRSRIARGRLALAELVEPGRRRPDVTGSSRNPGSGGHVQDERPGTMDDD